MSQLWGVVAMPKSGGDRSKMTMTRKELETAAIRSHEAGMPWANFLAHRGDRRDGRPSRTDAPRCYDRLVGKLIGLVAAG